jgi:dimethylargininase
MSRVTDFTHAIVRRPGRSVVQGIRDGGGADPAYDGVVAEHESYVAALLTLGLAVDMLPPLEDFPDSIFVEDPAFVIPEGAILLRPGAPARLAEREALRPALARHFGSVIEIADGALVDGGDVLITPRAILIGLSKRTGRTGAEALRAALAKLGREACIVETPHDVLHLKTASALLDDNTIVCTRAMAESGIFTGFEIVLTPEGEEAAANLLRINGAVLVGAAYKRTIDLLTGKGFAVTALPTGEIAKLDAGLSCMSLRWS